MNEFLREFDVKKKEIELLLRQYAPEMKGDQSLLAEAMNYSFLAGGKRIRPMIILEIFRLFGGKKEDFVHPFVAAIEMIHSYSLIHDDLPAMDNDDFRRGRPTNHKIYGETLAILAGDALLNFAYETAGRAFEASETIEDYKRVAKALAVLSENAGIFGMVTGQVMDMNLSGKPKTKEFLAKMYELKTGALLRACFMIGAILAGVCEEEVLSMKEVGEKIGLAFQLRDDVLDVEGDPGVTGKTMDSDLKNQKLTYLRILGLENAEKLIAELSEQVQCKLRELNEKNKEYDGFLLRLIAFLENRDR